MREVVSIEELNELFKYDHKTGLLTYRSDGRNAGTTYRNRGQRYSHVMIKRKMYKCHRIVIAIFTGKWPNGIVDHINGDGADNRIENLRETDLEGNAQNRRLNKNNKSGIRGVNWKADSEKWRVRIQFRGKRILVGDYKTLTEAEDARKNAALMYYEVSVCDGVDNRAL